MIIRRIAALSGLGAGLILSGCAIHQQEVADSPMGDEELLLDTDPKRAAETALSTVSNRASSDRTRALESFFREGDYEEALEMAKDLKAISQPGTEERDVAEFIEAVSLYYLGRHGEAAPLLGGHLKTYPGSRHRESAVFFEGSNLTKLGRWRAASEKLDGFLSEYPESVLMEYALHDRAAAHLAMGEHEEAIRTSEDLQRRFVYSKIRDRASVVQGDALLALGRNEAAMKAYSRAYEGATKLNHPLTEARALRGLIDVSGRMGDLQKSAAFYRLFFQKHDETKEALAAAVAGLPAMKGLGQLDEGFKRVESVLVGQPGDAPVTRIRSALEGYGKFYREAKGAEELEKHYANLSGKTGIAKRLREQLVVARLDVLETHFPERDAEIRVFYDEIVRTFDRDDLSSETLMKIARRLEESDRVEARKIYMEVMARPVSNQKGEATLAVAKLDAGSEETERQQAAIDGFSRVIHLYGDVDLAESATVELARLHSRREEWQEAYSSWDSYLQNPLWTSARIEAEEGRAAAKEKAGANFTEVPAATPVVVAEASDPYQEALEHAMDLVKKGEKNDAFKLLGEMLEGTDDLAIEPSEEAKTAIRRASIIRQDLAVELGLQAGVGASEP